ncbi:hypothetical protein [Tellurirhabdus rosea]|nr:hypothetical protein [Tellurirhabdus rosea]
MKTFLPLTSPARVVGASMPFSAAPVASFAVAVALPCDPQRPGRR